VLDTVRYEHHARHRGQDNRHLAQSFWVEIFILVAAVAFFRFVVWWELQW
jgi:hypothetical protein